MWATAKWITDNILKVLGAAGDTGGSATAGTATAKMNAVITNTATNNTSSKTGVLSQKHAYTHSLLESSSYGLSAIFSKVSGGGVPVVKSVQRGVVGLASFEVEDINISTVNPSKCAVSVFPTNQPSAQRDMFAYCSNLSSTVLTVKQGPGSYVPGAGPGFSWQIVEFY